MAFQPCDTYFVEDLDNGIFATQHDARDFKKLIARQRQELMANELSRLAADNYLDDIMNHMRQMEVKRLDFFI
jgi:hypothetical protein